MISVPYCFLTDLYVRKTRTLSNGRGRGLSSLGNHFNRSCMINDPNASVNIFVSIRVLIWKCAFTVSLRK